MAVKKFIKCKIERNKFNRNITFEKGNAISIVPLKCFSYTK